MNKIYKVVWNTALGTWVAVSELTKSKGKSKSLKTSNNKRIRIRSIRFTLTAITVATGSYIGMNSAIAAGGVYINDGTDNGCMQLVDSGGTNQGVNAACNVTANTQTTESMFFGPSGTAKDANGASSSLSLGQNLYVNGGRAGITDILNGTYSTRIGSQSTLNGSAGANAIAIGSSQTSTSDGSSSTATSAAGNQSIAIGSAASSTQTNAIAIGASSSATSSNSSSFGAGASATVQGATAVGYQAISSGANGLAVGSSSQVINKNSNATAIGENSIAGNSSNSTYGQQVAVGSKAQATGDQSTALGNDVKATGNSSIAIGADDINSAIDSAGTTYTSITGDTLTKSQWQSTTSSGAASTALGAQAVSNGAFSSALGMKSTANGNASLALGTTSLADGQGSIAVGAVSKAYQSGSVAVGINSYANGNNAVAIGSGSTKNSGANASANNAAAFGSGSSASALNTTALGTSSSATSEKATAVGFSAAATGLYSTAVGNNTIANIDAASAYGSGAQATKKGSTALGNDTLASGTNSVAVGAGNSTNQSGLGATASGTSSSALGYQSVASGATTTALGTSSSATADGSVALGSSSVASTKAGSIGYNPLTGTTSDATTSTWKSTTGAVSVGNTSSSITRQITGLAAGTQDTDAVNVAQLKQSRTYMSNLAASTAAALGGGASAGSTTGTLNGPSYTITGTDGSQNAYTDVGSALGALNSQVTQTLGFSGDSGTNVSRALGQTLSIQGGVTDSTKLSSANNIGVVANGTDGLSIKLAKAVDLGSDGSITTGNTVQNNAGITTTDSNGNTAILSGSGTSITGKDSSGNSISADYGLTGSTLKDGSGNTNTSTATTNTLKDGATGSSTATNAAGTTVTAKDSSGNSTGQAVYGANNSTYTNYTNGTAAGTTVVGGTGLSFTDANGKATGPSVTAAGIDANGTTISNLKDGTASTDAATKGQLDSVSANSVQYDKNTDGTVNYNSITAGGGKGTAAVIGTDSKGNTVVTSGGTTLTNIANGVNASDAVNKGQLDTVAKSSGASGTSTAAALGGGATYDASTGTISTPSYTTLNTDGTKSTANNVGDALTNLNNQVVKPITFGGDTGTNVSRKLGETLTVKGGVTDTSKLTNNNIGVVANGTDGLTVQLAKAVDLGSDGSITTGNTVQNNAGITTTDSNGNTAILSGSGTSITGKDSSGNSISADYGLTGSTLKDGSGNTNTSTATTNTLKDGATGSSTATNAAGTTVTAKDSSGNTIGQAVYGANNSTYTNYTNGTAAGTTVVGGTGLSFTDANGKATGPSVTATGVNANGTKITNLKDGTASTDAATKGQLDSVSANSVQYDKNTDGTVNYNSITAGGGKGTAAVIGTDSKGNTVVTSGGTTLTNIANGVNASDAVNKGQLDTVAKSSGASGTSTAAALGGGATYDASTGTISAPTYTTTNTDGTTSSANNVGDALTNLNNQVVKPITFGGDTGTNVSRKLGETLTVKGGVTDTSKLTNNNIGVVANGTDGLTVQLAKAVDLGSDGSITTGNTVQNNAGITTTDSNGNTAILSGSGTSITGKDSSGNSISADYGLTGSTLKDGSGNTNTSTATTNTLKDGATGSSTATNAAGTTVTAKDSSGNTIGQAVYGANNSTYTNYTNGTAAGTTVVGGTGLSFTDANGKATGPSVTATGVNANGTTISNLKDGTASTDAATKGQLDSVSANSVQYDKNTDGTVNYNSITAGGGKGTAAVIGTDSKGNTVVTSGGTTLTNIANGVNASDAVNKGQLDTVAKSSGASGTSTAAALGGGATYDASTGTISTPSYTTLNTDGTKSTANNVGDALTNLNNQVVKPITFGGDTGTNVSRKLGETLTVKGGVTDTSKLTNNNIGVVANGTDGLTVQLAKAVDLGSDGSITTGNTVQNNAGITTTDSNGNTAILSGSGTSITGKDSSGNSISADYGLTGSTLKDGSGNTNTSTATTNTLKDGATGSSTATNAAGTTVTAKDSSGNTTGQAVYGANNSTYTNGTAAGTTVVGGTGLSFTDANGKATGPSITAAGIDANGTTISNLKDGTASTDAATKGQLDAIASAGSDKSNTAGTSTAAALGGGATYDASTGTISAPTYTTTNTDGTTSSANNVGDALTNLNNQVVKPITFGGDTGTNVSRKLGETLTVKGGVTDTSKLTNNNIGVVANGTDGLTVQLAKAVDLGSDGSITTGNTVQNNAGITTTDSNGNTAILSGSGTSITGKDSSGNSISADYGLTGSTLKDGSGNTNTSTATTNTLKDGATGSSTATNAAGTTVTAKDSSGNSTGQAVYGANNSTYTNYTNGTAAGTTVVGGTGLSFTDANGKATGPSVTAAGIDANGTTISNLKDGTASTDAATKGQLDAIASAGSDKSNTAGTSTAAALGGGATYDASTGTISTPTYTTTNTDGTTSSANNVGDALTNLNNQVVKPITFGGDTGTNVSRKLGETLTVKGGVTDTSKLTNNNIGVVANGTDGLTVQLAKAVDLGSDGSITTGNTVQNNAGITTTDSNGNTAILSGSGTSITGKDSSGNSISADYGLTGSTIKDGSGNTNTSTATTNTLKDGATGSSTATNAAGTTVTAKDSSGNTIGQAVYGANNSTYTNYTNGTATGTTVVGGTGLSFTDANGKATGPSVTAAGIDANGTTISNLKDGTASTDAATKGQLDNEISQVTSSVSQLSGNAVQYDKNADGTVNYNSVTAGGGKGTAAVIGTNSNGDSVVTSGGTTLSNIANGVNASDAVNKGQLDTLATAVSNSVTNVIDGGGNSVNITNQIVNQNVNNSNEDSNFIIYNKKGQTTTDGLTLAQTVQSMNKNGVKYSHTNGVKYNVNGKTNDASAGGEFSTAIGVNAIIDDGADNTVALGVNTSASDAATNSVVIGNKSKVSGVSSVAIGDEATASGIQSISIGTGNTVSGNHSGALGDPSIVNGNSSYSVGNGNTVGTDDTFVLGNGVTQTTNGSVVLGTGSASRTAGGVAGYTPTTIASGDKQAILATTATTGSVAVGDSTNGVYRQITGVAAGTQDSDAVNLSQLKSVNNKVDTSTNSIVSIIGGNSKVNTDGSITAPTYNISGQTQTTISGALNALNTAVQEANTTGKPINVESVTAGNTVLDKNGISMSDGAGNTSSMTASNVVLKDSSGNATTTTASGMTVVNNTTGTNAKYNADSTVYTAKDGSSTYIGTNGLNFKDSSGNSTGPSVSKSGIDAGGTTITNVADGKNATDAVNKGQLDSAVSSVNTTVSNLSNASVQYDKNADGSVNKGKITLGGGSTGTTITNVADGAIQQGSKDAVNGGQVAAVRDNLQNQITTNSNSISNIQNTVSDLSSGKSGIVQQADNNSDINIGKSSGGTKVTVSGTSGNRQVTGVANGAVSSTSSDAMNGSQLYTSNSNVASYLGGGATVGSDGQVTAPSYALSDGKTYHDVGSAVSSVDGRVENLEQAFGKTTQQIDSLRKNANAGIAGAIAIASLGQPFEKGSSALSLGTGTWNNATNIAIGTSGITEDHRLFGKPVNYIWKMAGTSDFKGNSGGGGSITVTWK